jgi:hypothetical protein
MEDGGESASLPWLVNLLDMTRIPWKPPEPLTGVEVPQDLRSPDEKAESPPLPPSPSFNEENQQTNQLEQLVNQFIERPGSYCVPIHEED